MLPLNSFHFFDSKVWKKARVFEGRNFDRKPHPKFSVGLARDYFRCKSSGHKKEIRYQAPNPQV